MAVLFFLYFLIVAVTLEDAYDLTKLNQFAMTMEAKIIELDTLRNVIKSRTITFKETFAQLG